MLSGLVPLAVFKIVEPSVKPAVGGFDSHALPFFFFRQAPLAIMVEKTLVTWHPHAVSREDRERLNGHRGCVVWFTGYSGCGKSTVANALDRRLYDLGVRSFVLDGDNIRHGLNASPAMLMESGEEYARRFGLAFSEQDRQENIRRIGAVAHLFSSAAIVALTAFVSPYRRDRDAVRRLVESSGRTGDFVEVFVDTPLEICETRDPKGLYKKARAGQLSGMTGIDDPYEPPLNPELTLDGASRSPEELAEQVVAWLRSAGHVGDHSSERSRHELVQTCTDLDLD